MNVLRFAAIVVQYHLDTNVGYMSSSVLKNIMYFINIAYKKEFGTSVLNRSDYDVINGTLKIPSVDKEYDVFFSGNITDIMTDIEEIDYRYDEETDSFEKDGRLILKNNEEQNIWYLLEEYFETLINHTNIFKMKEYILNTNYDEYISLCLNDEDYEIMCEDLQSAKKREEDLTFGEIIDLISD